MQNNNYLVKEYFDINSHYIKISLVNNKDIHIVSYNTDLLNGIKYETLIKAEEIMKKSQNNELSCQKLYDLMIQKIEGKKYIIKSDLNSVNIVLLETSNIFNQNADIQIIIPKNKAHITTEYEKVLSNEITKLKEENKKLINSFNELKNMLELNNCIRNNNNLNNQQPNKLSSYTYNSNMSKSNKLQLSKADLKNSKNLNNNIKNNINNNIDNNLDGQYLKNNPGLFTNNPSLNNNISNNNLQNSSNPNNSLLKSKEINSLTLSRLSDLKFGNYPIVELGSNPLFKIAAYGANSYNGTVRDYNEDKLKIISEYKLNKKIQGSNGKEINPNISYFAIYDGHGGNKCSIFLQENLHEYIFSSDYFPLYPLQAIYQAYEKAETNFESIAYDKEKKNLLDKSGSCALSALIIDDACYVTNLGDSRGLYSYDSGKQLFQITRDHKPNDENEKKRIEEAGGKIYKDTRLKVDGVRVRVNEKDAPGFKFPYRVSPGNLAVSFYII